MLSTSRVQLFRLAGQASRPLATWIGNDYVDSPNGKVEEETRDRGSMGYKKVQEMNDKEKEYAVGRFSRSDEDLNEGLKRIKKVQGNLKEVAEAPAENIRTEGAGQGPLGYKNSSGAPLQGKKTTITTTRNIYTSVLANTVKDTAVDKGHTTSIDAVGEIPSAENAKERAKMEKVTKKALKNIPGEKGTHTGAQAGMTEKIKEGVSETVEGVKHAAEKVKEKGEELIDKAKRTIGVK